MQQSWMSLFLQGVFWIVSMALLTRWLGRSRMRARPNQDARRLVQPLGILIIGVIGLVMFGGAFIAALIWPDDGMTVWPYLIFAALLSLSVHLILDYFFARHEVRDDGMAFGRAMGERGSFTWTEIRRVSFNKRMNWYRITLDSGRQVRLYGTLMGLPEFARATLAHVPALRIDPDALTILQEAAHAKLHGMWP